MPNSPRNFKSNPSPYQQTTEYSPSYDIDEVGDDFEKRVEAGEFPGLASVVRLPDGSTETTVVARHIRHIGGTYWPTSTPSRPTTFAPSAPPVTKFNIVSVGSVGRIGDIGNGPSSRSSARRATFQTGKFKFGKVGRIGPKPKRPINATGVRENQENVDADLAREKARQLPLIHVKGDTRQVHPIPSGAKFVFSALHMINAEMGRIKGPQRLSARIRQGHGLSELYEALVGFVQQTQFTSLDLSNLLLYKMYISDSQVLTLLDFLSQTLTRASHQEVISIDLSHNALGAIEQEPLLTVLKQLMQNQCTINLRDNKLSLEVKTELLKAQMQQYRDKKATVICDWHVDETDPLSCAPLALNSYLKALEDTPIYMQLFIDLKFKISEVIKKVSEWAEDTTLDFSRCNLTHISHKDLAELFDIPSLTHIDFGDQNLTLSQVAFIKELAKSHQHISVRLGDGLTTTTPITVPQGFFSTPSIEETPASSDEHLALPGRR